MRTGWVFNLQRFSVHDGPGIRTTVFLQGCPLRCSWCHNPEGLDVEPVPAGIPGLCIGCASCAAACPEGVARRLDLEPDSLARRERCTRCGSCIDACPSGARVMFGRSYDVSALMLDLEKDRVFYEESGGGVTFSGGEPLAPGNLEFLLECLRTCGERGFHRAVDTSGHAALHDVLETARHCELFLYDLKLMDPAAHRLHTGVGNEWILRNVRALSEAGHDLWIRVPLVPGVNDGADNLAATADFVESLPRAHPLHLLPYHAMGRDKHARLGSEYAMSTAGRASDAVVSAAADTLRRRRLDVRIGG
jgi:pyruvate formate lyase activating enzyme